MDKEEIVATIEICAILHDILVRMSQEGASEEKTFVKNCQLDKISQFIDEEQSNRDERQAEVVPENEALGAFGGDGRLCPADLHVFIDTLDIIQDFCTGYMVKYSISDELIAYCSELGDGFSILCYRIDVGTFLVLVCLEK